MLVAMALLGLVITISVRILETSRRSYSSARENADQAAIRESALSSLSTALTTITFLQRPAFSPDGSRLEMESDQHFVCGPVRELLPDVKNICGDALFLQRQTSNGTTEATGFFVQFGDDFPWRASLPNLKARQRFRLLQFHQTSQELSLYGSPQTGGSGQPSGMTSRASVNHWFATPLARITASNCSVVADNIVVMLIDTVPDSGGGWDTRRYRWAGESGTGSITRNRLPAKITMHFLTVDEALWKRLEETQSVMLAHEIRTLCNRYRAFSSPSSSQTLKAISQKLESKSIACRIVTHTFGINSGR